MKKMLGIFLVFVLFAVLGFFLVGFQNSVPQTPANTTANQTFANQTATMKVGYVGLEMILSILIAAMVITSGYWLYKVTRRHKGYGG